MDDKDEFFISFCKALAQRITLAELKHPASEWAGKGIGWGLMQVACETGEALQAKCKQEPEWRVQDELLDVCATAYRTVRGDWQ